LRIKGPTRCAKIQTKTPAHAKIACSAEEFLIGALLHRGFHPSVDWIFFPANYGNNPPVGSSCSTLIVAQSGRRIQALSQQELLARYLSAVAGLNAPWLELVTVP
jgi:hypothetical protein